MPDPQRTKKARHPVGCWGSPKNREAPLTRKKALSLQPSLFSRPDRGWRSAKPRLKSGPGPLHIHPLHTAHTAHAVAAGAGTLFFFHQLGHHRFGREQQAGDRSCVLQRRARDLGRVDYAHLYQIAVGFSLRIEAEVALAFGDLVQHDRGLFARVGDDLAQRLFQGAAHDLDAGFLVGVVAPDLVQSAAGADVSDAAAGDDAFLDRGAGRVQRVLDAGLSFLHLDFGRGADLDDRNAAGELGYPLLQLFLVVIAGGFLDLGADALDPRLDRLGIAGTVDEGRLFLVHFDTLRRTEVLQRRFLEGQPDFFGNDLAAGENGDVLEHGLAAVAEPRRLHRAGLEDAAQVVHDQRREGFVFDFLGDDEQRPSGLGHLLEERKQIADIGNLLVVQKNIGVLQYRHLLFGVVDEIGRQVAAVELHALDYLELGLQALAVLDRDHAFLADLLHCIRDDLADLDVRIGGNGADLGDFLAGGAGLGDLLQLLDHRDDRLVDPAFQVHRVHPRSDVFHPFLDDRLRQHCGGGGAVAGDIRSLGGDFLHHLRAHVLELVLQLDFLGDRHAVLGHGRRAEGALQDHVTALGTEGHLDRVGENVDPGEQLVPRGFVETYVFGRHVLLLNGLVLLRDDTHDVVFTHHEVLGAFDLHGLAGELAEQDAVADLDVERAHLAVFENLAFAHGDDFALVGLLRNVVGDDDAARGFALFIETLHHNAVVQGTDFHHDIASLTVNWRPLAVRGQEEPARAKLRRFWRICDIRPIYWPLIDTMKFSFCSLNGDGM